MREAFNLLGYNVLNFIALSLGAFLVTYIAKAILRIFHYFLGLKIMKVATKHIPEGINYGNVLKASGYAGEKVLEHTIRKIELLVIKSFPPHLRPIVDRLIRADKIAQAIRVGVERELTDRKLKKLHK